MNWSWWDGSKLALTALIIVVVTKIQVVNDKLSALLIALPLMSLIAMMWMRAHRESCREHLLVRFADFADVPRPSLDAPKGVGIRALSCA